MKRYEEAARKSGQQHGGGENTTTSEHPSGHNGQGFHEDIIHLRHDLRRAMGRGPRVVQLDLASLKAQTATLNDAIVDHPTGTNSRVHIESNARNRDCNFLFGLSISRSCSKRC